MLPQLGANLLTDHSPVFTVLAATPVLLWWWVFLYAVPKQFKSSSMDYMTKSQGPDA
jgi:hypothetical protein